AFKKDDWLVLPQYRWQGDRFAGGVHKQSFTPDEARTEPAFQVVVHDRVPWQTIINFYSGLSAVEHHEGPRLEVEVRRVTEDHDPRREDVVGRPARPASVAPSPSLALRAGVETTSKGYTGPTPCPLSFSVPSSPNAHVGAIEV